MPGEGLFYFVATTLLSVAVLAGCWWIGHRRERATPWLMAGVLVLLICKAVLHHRPDWETALFHWPGYVFFQGYWIYPLGIAVLALGIGRLPVRWNRAVVASVACLFCALGVWNARWMVATIDDSSQRTADARHHCRQTTGYTCAPSSCVMLLSMYGIAATEGEMARCCLTGSWGTSTFDMYRGLLVKLRDTDLRPQVVHLDVDELRTLDRSAIVGHGSRHAWVIRVDGTNIECLDPLFEGPRTVAFERFAEEFTGFAVLLDRPPDRLR